MKKSIDIKRMGLLLLILCAFGFGCRGEIENFSIINLDHLDHLYQEINLNNQRMAIVHIYAEYPHYDWKDAPGEGMACIDDVSRAAVFYMKHYKYTQQPSNLQKAKRLLNFILYMQAPNGLFYNFINSDLTINKIHKNSTPKATWWSWRAVWALAEGHELFNKTNAEFSQMLTRSIEKTFPAIDSVLHKYPVMLPYSGLSQPTWLPYGSGADQSAVLLLGLVQYYHATQDSAVRRRIDWIGEGLLALQVGDSTQFPYSAFMSWGNMWHAYGNLQAYALLNAGEALNDKNVITRALNELRFFYPYLMKQNYLSQFTVVVEGDSIIAKDMLRFSQIAYNIRPMVWASLQAYKHTGFDFYARQAGDIACWLLGKNITGNPVYDPQTGRCFDGIEDYNKLNRNSGAESTIEALLTILEVEMNPLARTILHEYYRKRFHYN